MEYAAVKDILTFYRVCNIQNVTILPGGTNGWNIDSILTFGCTIGLGCKPLTQDIDVFRWVDGNGSQDRRRFPLTKVSGASCLFWNWYSNNVVTFCVRTKRVGLCLHPILSLYAYPVLPSHFMLKLFFFAVLLKHISKTTACTVCVITRFCTCSSCKQYPPTIQNHNCDHNTRCSSTSLVHTFINLYHNGNL